MMSAGNELLGARPKAATHPATLDERSLHRNLEAACHSSIVHILGFFYALSLGQIAAKRGGKPLLFLRYVGLFSFAGRFGLVAFRSFAARKLRLNAPKQR